MKKQEAFFRACFVEFSEVHICLLLFIGLFDYHKIEKQIRVERFINKANIKEYVSLILQGLIVIYIHGMLFFRTSFLFGSMFKQRHITLGKMTAISKYFHANTSKLFFRQAGSSILMLSSGFFPNFSSLEGSSNQWVGRIILQFDL